MKTSLTFENPMGFNPGGLARTLPPLPSGVEFPRRRPRTSLRASPPSSDRAVLQQGVMDRSLLVTDAAGDLSEDKDRAMEDNKHSEGLPKTAFSLGFPSSDRAGGDRTVLLTGAGGDPSEDKSHTEEDNKLTHSQGLPKTAFPMGFPSSDQTVVEQSLTDPTVAVADADRNCSQEARKFPEGLVAFALGFGFGLKAQKKMKKMMKKKKGKKTKKQKKKDKKKKKKKMLDEGKAFSELNFRTLALSYGISVGIGIASNSLTKYKSWKVLFDVFSGMFQAFFNGVFATEMKKWKLLKRLEDNAKGDENEVNKK